MLSPLKTVIGCLINYRGLHAKCDPLLYDDSTYNIDLSSKYGERRDTLLGIYVDFGSSSSAIGYKFAKGDLDYTSITGGTPLVRELLASADKKRYSNFINFADDCYVRTAPSVSITYEGDKADDFIPYHNGWQPFMNKFTEFELKKIVTDVSHKTGLIHNDKSQSPQLIISSLCFTALCHAANLGCRNVMFYPSLPNKNYTDYLGFIWDNVLDTMKKVFDINTSHLLRSKDNHFLYESIAFSNGAMDAGRNVMIVNIDMGDSTTDFSAVYTDKFGHRKICGYSSIEYAGKNLLKESLRNILAHMDSVRTAKKFMLGSDSSNPFIIRSFYDDVSENIAENICMKFFPNDKRKGRPRNYSWQNLFMQLLQTASINTASGKDSINVKAKADIILRYAVLIPVIRDFTAVSLDLCESDKNTAVTIHISGGAAKGFMLADEFVNGSLPFTERINKYIKANFEGSYGICSVEIADGDPKFQLIKGLSRLDSHKDGDGTYSIYMADGEDGISIDWDRIKPNSVDHYSDPKRIKKCSGFRFRKIEKVEDITYNIEQRSKPSSCIPEDVYGDMRIFMKEILDHFLFEKEFRALTDNSFFTNASKATIDGIRRQFFRDDPESGGTDTSFKKAADSEIYPEMIKNAAYMFEVSRLLSHNFGKTFSSADAAAEGKDNGFSI